mmetsp:Transcript_40695/g.86678  ORF Transcript_40695/g.86678 Transcript_40695/m.86678 type:complete len:230 (+) Transcript_40695:331-1020(+)
MARVSSVSCHPAPRGRIRQHLLPLSVELPAVIYLHPGVAHVQPPQLLVHVHLESVHLPEHPSRHVLHVPQRLGRILLALVQQLLRRHDPLVEQSRVGMDPSRVGELVHGRLTVLNLLEVSGVRELAVLATLHGETGRLDAPFELVNGGAHLLVVVVVLDLVDGREGREHIGDRLDGGEVERLARFRGVVVIGGIGFCIVGLLESEEGLAQLVHGRGGVLADVDEVQRGL